MLILSLFMNRSNQVFTAYGDTPSYRVRISIDQGEVISPLLWVIYIDPLLSVLKKEMLDPYILQSLTLLPSVPNGAFNIAINNLVFMDDSTLISSTKTRLEYMLTITEEFYALNNTSANHQKYVLISNSLPLITTSTISPVEFNLSLSSLNRISSIFVTSISVTSSFRFLGVWFNIKGSRNFTAYRAAYIAQLADKRDRSLPHKWYLDIQAHTTIPDSHDHLHSRFVCSSSVTPTATLIPVSYSRRLNISPDFSSSSLVADDDLVQLVPDAGYLNSVATYAHGTIRHWPFFTRAEVAVIFAALSVSPDDSTISIYTDSQAAIDGLRLCASSSYTNSCSYYMTTNFELWASIECSIRAKLLAVFPVKVKGHAGNYWNEFTDSLANSAHRSDDAICLSMADFTSSHNVRLSTTLLFKLAMPQDIIPLNLNFFWMIYPSWKS
ncbi:ribonuclease H-like domain-containing protein [Rhizophagus clarus]|uniref:Ribonuclease H-like domain-containing protein n=1 Tax=Rhizophagus clarus TaxID=94130 RepID=A0A8H3M6L2_9GLOM|nr:ribonuclease H-like domain-containing protein [Rhizophagus clarus]